MRNQMISEIEQAMASLLNSDQLAALRAVLIKATSNVLILSTSAAQSAEQTDLLSMFISAKRVEGCSERTLNYYRSTLDKMLTSVSKPIKAIA